MPRMACLPPEKTGELGELGADSASWQWEEAALLHLDPALPASELPEENLLQCKLPVGLRMALGSLCAPRPPAPSPGLAHGRCL